MRTLLKGILLLMVIALIGAVVVYNTPGDFLHEKLREKLASKLSQELGRPVEIGTLDTKLPCSVYLKDILVFRTADRSDEYVSIKSISIDPSPLSLFKTGRLESTVKFNKLNITNTLQGATGALRITSPKITDFKKILQLSLVEKISVNATTLSIPKLGIVGDDSQETISGTIILEGTEIQLADIALLYDNMPYNLALRKNTGFESTYAIELGCTGIELKGTFIKDNTELFLRNIKGSVYGIPVTLKANIKNFMHPSDAIITMDGELETLLQNIGASRSIARDISSLPGRLKRFAPFAAKIETFIRDNALSGRIKAGATMTGQGLKFKKHIIMGKVYISDLEADTSKLGNINGAVQIQDDRVSLRRISWDLGFGKAKADMLIDLRSTSVPYKLEFELVKADLEELDASLYGKDRGMNGKLQASLSLSGSLISAVNSKGSCRLDISSARISTFPLIGSLANKLSSYSDTPLEAKDLSLTSVSGEFTLDKQRLVADTLMIEGNDVVITGKGSIGLNGNLSFEFYPRLRESLVLPDLEEPYNIRFEAFLAGSLKAPLWRFE